MDFELRCIECHKEATGLGVMVCPSCGGDLTIAFDLRSVGRRYDPKSLGDGPGHWKYHFLLPSLGNYAPMSLGEGATPLVLSHRLAAGIGLRRLYFKREDQNPTQSFKDRLMSVAATLARQLGKSRLFLESSGNAGAAAAAYGARAGMDVAVAIGEKIPRTKVAQALAYGARVAVLRGLNDDATTYYRAILDLQDAATRRGWWPVGPARGLNPYVIEGAKTIAFEVCEQLGWVAPDSVVVPVGGGALCGAVWKGFRELVHMGWIDSMPRIIGVQESGRGVPVEAAASALRRIRDGADISREHAGCKFVPLDGQWAWEAVTDSRGAMLTVSLTEMREAVTYLARQEGIFAEPLATRAVAGLLKAVGAGLVAGDDVVVCLVSGSGMKDPDSIAVSREELPRADIAEGLFSLAFGS